MVLKEASIQTQGRVHRETMDSWFRYGVTERRVLEGLLAFHLQRKETLRFLGGGGAETMCSALDLARRPRGGGGADGAEGQHGQRASGKLWSTSDNRSGPERS